MNHQAIYNRYPNVKFIIDESTETVAYDENEKKVVLNKTTIQEETDIIKVAYAINQYRIDRIRGTILNSIKYDTIGNQLDMIYWDQKDGTDRFIKHIDSVKLAHPKPI